MFGSFLFLILHSRHFISLGAISPHDASWRNGSWFFFSLFIGSLFRGLLASMEDGLSVAIKNTQYLVVLRRLVDHSMHWSMPWTMSMHRSQTPKIAHNFTQKRVLFNHYLDILIYYELFKSNGWLVTAVYKSSVIHRTPPEPLQLRPPPSPNQCILKAGEGWSWRRLERVGGGWFPGGVSWLST